MRSQVEELQRELQFATNKMLAGHSSPSVATARTASRPAPAEQAPPAAVPDLGGDDDLFSGLDLASVPAQAPGAAPPVPAAARAPAPVAQAAVHSSNPSAVGAQPLASQLPDVPSGVSSGWVNWQPACLLYLAAQLLAACQRPAQRMPGPPGSRSSAHWPKCEGISFYDTLHAAMHRAALDEDLFTSLSEPEPQQPAAAAPTASQPPAAGAGAGPGSPPTMSPAAAEAAATAARPGLPDLGLLGSLASGSNAAQGVPAPAPGVRRKKVIRSRIGYARGATEQQQQPAAMPFAAAVPPPTAPVPVPSAAPAAAAPARPASVASECGSPQLSEGGDSTLAGGRDGRAASRQDAGRGSRAATPTGSHGSAPTSSQQAGSRHQQQHHAAAGRSSGRLMASGSGVAAAVQLEQEGTEEHAEQEADLLGAGGLAERLRRGMNLGLELPARPVHGRAGSTGSADSTVAMRGIAGGGGGYDSDDSITSPEFRPPSEARCIPPAPEEAAVAPPAAAARSAGLAAMASPRISPPRSPPKHASLTEQVAAAQAALQQQAAALEAQLGQQAQQERGFKADRLRLGSDISALAGRPCWHSSSPPLATVQDVALLRCSLHARCHRSAPANLTLSLRPPPHFPLLPTAKLEQLQDAESEAVGKEDFELAASLGAESDAARAQLAGLQQQLKVGDIGEKRGVAWSRGHAVVVNGVLSTRVAGSWSNVMLRSVFAGRHPCPDIAPTFLALCAGGRARGAAGSGPAHAPAAAAGGGVGAGRCPAGHHARGAAWPDLSGPAAS